MAWRTKDGRTSDRELETAIRRGTQPRTGIRVRKTTEQQLAEGAAIRENLARILAGDLWGEDD